MGPFYELKIDVLIIDYFNLIENEKIKALIFILINCSYYMF